MKLDLAVLSEDKRALDALAKANGDCAPYGLSLSDAQMKAIVVHHHHSCRKFHLLAMGEGILGNLMRTFADCYCMKQDILEEQILKLSDLFLQYRKEVSRTLFTDEELLDLMREQFEKICYGDLEEMEENCLPYFLDAIQAGLVPCDDEDSNNSVVRWDHDRYFQAMKEMCTW